MFVVFIEAFFFSLCDAESFYTDLMFFFLFVFVFVFLSGYLKNAVEILFY